MYRDTDYDQSSLLKRISLLEDRLGYFENCFQVSEKKVIEMSRHFESMVRQISDLNFGNRRIEERYEGSITKLEKCMQSVQHNISMLEKNQDEKINQLVSQLVEPTFKDIDYTIKQEVSQVYQDCQREIEKIQEGLQVNNRKSIQHTPKQKEQEHRIVVSDQQEETRKKIDEEIQRRMNEENEKRRNTLDNDFKSHKAGQMSTEKSRSREIQNRLNLERKAKQDKINQLNEIYQFRKH